MTDEQEPMIITQTLEFLKLFYQRTDDTQQFTIGQLISVLRTYLETFSFLKKNKDSNLSLKRNCFSKYLNILELWNKQSIKTFSIRAS